MTTQERRMRWFGLLLIFGMACGCDEGATQGEDPKDTLTISDDVAVDATGLDAPLLADSTEEDTAGDTQTRDTRPELDVSVDAVDTNAGDTNSADVCGPCGAEMACVGGVCVCASGFEDCDGTCVDLASDALHCSACRQACAQNEVCGSGSCECGSGFEDCNGAPGDGCEAELALDSAHCGACDNACDVGLVCAAGSCPCAALEVISAMPLPNARGVGTASLISMALGCALDTSTVDASTFLVYSAERGVVSGTLSFPTSKSVMFAPSGAWLGGERVEVVATSSISSASGAALVPFAWQFEVVVAGGGARFSRPGTELYTGSTYAVAVGDVSGDGALDIFFGDLFGNQVWINDGSGVFTDSGQLLLPQAAHGVALGDLDGDGDLDAFTSRFQVGNVVFFNDGAGQFQAAPQGAFGLTTDGYDVALGDFDGDGDLDAAVANGSPKGNDIWLNDGAGQFASTVSLGVLDSRGVAAGDVNGDGRLDLVFANNFSGHANTVWLGDGVGGFTLSASLGSSKSRGVALGDLDADGDLDAFFVNYDSQANRVWWGDGLGGFVDSGQALGTGSSYDLALGDLDADGDLDAFIAEGSISNTVWRNDGGGIFAESSTRYGEVNTVDVALGDLNADGDLDAVTANQSGTRANRVWTAF